MMRAALALALWLAASGDEAVRPPSRHNVANIGAPPVPMTNCSVDIQVGEITYRLTTFMPLPPHANMLARMRIFMKDNDVVFGAGCDTADCVAERLAERIYARCAINEYSSRIEAMHGDLTRGIAAGADDDALLALARSRTFSRCAVLAGLEICATLRTPALAYTDRPVVAHCVAGLARTLPYTAASISKRVVDALAPGDVFLVLGSPQAAAAPALAWEAAVGAFSNLVQFAVSDGNGQLQKLQLCFAHVEAAEAASGRRYAAIARHRPDLLWTRDVPRSLVAPRSVTHCRDVVAICGRDAVDTFWPCATDHTHETRIVGPLRVPTVPVCEPHFQFNMKRVVEAYDRAERHLHKSYVFADALAVAVSIDADAGGGLGDRLANCALDFLAWTCLAYDAYLADWVAARGALDAGGAMVAAAAHRSAPAGGPHRALHAAATHRSATDASAALRAIYGAYGAALAQAGVGVDGAGPGTAAYETSAGADADAAPRIAFLDAQCAPRATCSEGGDAYARALCDRSFAVDVLTSPFLHRRALTLGAVAGCGADATNATDAAAGREGLRLYTV